MAESWTQTFEVRSYETDPENRLSIPGLCNYCQEAAGVHAQETGISIHDLGRDNLTWVLGRLELQVAHLPGWREEVRVTTWPSRMRSFFVVRDFLVESEEHGVLARATSTWFVIDLSRRRAVRVPQVVRDLPRPERERAMEESWARLPRPERIDLSRRFDIRRSDLDVNVHVNHVKYLEWALETFDLDFFSSWRLASLEIDFLAELNFGDAVLTEAELQVEERTAVALFSVSRQDDSSEAARISTRWTPLST
jgi:acyl-ACP thioesterase